MSMINNEIDIAWPVERFTVLHIHMVSNRRMIFDSESV